MPIRPTVRGISVFAVVLALLGSPANDVARAADRPNVLWITCEDISANLGCYGDPDAITPHLDRLAGRSVRYTRAFSIAGVCAPSRSCLITGMYPSSLSTQYMRCRNQPPEFVRAYSAYLRDAGYYCTNNSKEDYNFVADADSWDESSRTAHWRHRAPDQPFFAIFNFTSTHESQIRLSPEQYAARTAKLTAAQRRDPSQIRLPAYLPDVPEARRDWANIHELITAFDYQVGELLSELEADGLADDTIIWYYSDHGVGLPRGKRWLYDSGMHVPLMIHFPEKYRALASGAPGSVEDRLVSFVDFGPTLLSLLDVEVPDHMQGEPFLGDQATEPRRFVHGIRDRMDERPDFIRAVRDGRYKYLRNFRPDLPYFQYISYMYQMPTMQAWQRLADAGELTGPPAAWMTGRKPIEELYDTLADPDEVVNLADSPEHAEVLQSMRGELYRWMKEIRDVGLLPEAEVFARRGEQSAYEWTRTAGAYDFDRYWRAAEVATWGDPSQRRALLADADGGVRFWGVVSQAIHRPPSAVEALRPSLGDENPTVRVIAADTCIALGAAVDDSVHDVLSAALVDDNPWVRQRAMLAIDRLGPAAVDFRAEVEQAREAATGPDPTMAGGYLTRVAEHILAHLPEAAR